MHKATSYAFRKQGNPPYMTLDSIGWQTVDSTDYSFDGEKRPDQGHIIFQYTLSGTGCIEIGSKVFRLSPGTAFFVHVPSLHRYYYDKEVSKEEPWEFIWLNAKGEDAVRLWERVAALDGPVVRLDPESTPIAAFWSLYREIDESNLRDTFQLSVRLYAFLISFLGPEAGRRQELQTNPVIERAKLLINDRLSATISLDELASHCGVGKHHLCRLFQRWEACSPLDYVRMRRMEAAIKLLRTTEIPVKDIGSLCGFDSPSYFGKVFRNQVGVSPAEYRKQKLAFPYETVYFE